MISKWMLSALYLFSSISQCHSFSNKGYSQKNTFHTRLNNIYNTPNEHFFSPKHRHRPSTNLQSSSIPIIEQAISSSSTTLSFIFTNEDVKQAFNVATFLPQPFWLLLIFIPNTTFTKKVMGGLGTCLYVVYHLMMQMVTFGNGKSFSHINLFSSFQFKITEVVGLFALVHLFIVITSAAQTDGTAPLAEFNDVFNPAGDPQNAMLGMMKYPNFVSEEWSHVLTWDLFVGRWIWLDGLKRGIFTSHSVLLSNLIGPPGLLLHWITCLISGKSAFPGNEALLLEGNEE